MISIRDWAFVLSGGPYQAPETCTQQLRGRVYNHPSGRFEDGDSVRTSHISRIDLPNRKVYTQNNAYMLTGPPDPEWVKWLDKAGLLDKYAHLLAPN
jgi:hypothetical protein